MTSTEAAVLRALRNGGQLTTKSLARVVNRAPWRVHLATQRLRRRGYIRLDSWRNQWQVYSTTAARHVV